MVEGKPQVAVIMASDSDWSTMKLAVELLNKFEIPTEAVVISAHRTPDKMINYAKSAAQKGIKVIIAGAGGAAHLPGMIASSTILPVIGVPVPTTKMEGFDSLLAIVQMPADVPVATMAIGGAWNAGILAAQILGIADPEVAKKVAKFKTELIQQVEQRDVNLQKTLQSMFIKDSNN